MKELLKSVIVSSVICLSGCTNTTTAVIGTDPDRATASESEVCRQLGQKLPTRSRSDTQLTQDEIQEQYAAYALACPDFAHLIPE